MYRHWQLQSQLQNYMYNYFIHLMYHDYHYLLPPKPKDMSSSPAYTREFVKLTNTCTFALASTSQPEGSCVPMYPGITITIPSLWDLLKIEFVLFIDIWSQ